MLRTPAEGGVNVPEAMQAARSIQLQIDIQHAALGALPAEPFPAFGDSAAEFDQRDTLARLAWANEQHLMTLPEDTVN